MKIATSVLFFLPSVAAAQTATGDDGSKLAQQVEILRTQYDVPHIRAENLKAAYFALAYKKREWPFAEQRRLIG